MSSACRLVSETRVDASISRPESPKKMHSRLKVSRIRRRGKAHAICCTPATPKSLPPMFRFCSEVSPAKHRASAEAPGSVIPLWPISSSERARPARAEAAMTAPVSPKLLQLISSTESFGKARTDAIALTPEGPSLFSFRLRSWSKVRFFSAEASVVAPRSHIELPCSCSFRRAVRKIREAARIVAPPSPNPFSVSELFKWSSVRHVFDLKISEILLAPTELIPEESSLSEQGLARAFKRATAPASPTEFPSRSSVLIAVRRAKAGASAVAPSPSNPVALSSSLYPSSSSSVRLTIEAKEPARSSAPDRSMSAVDSFNEWSSVSSVSRALNADTVSAPVIVPLSLRSRTRIVATMDIFWTEFKISGKGLNDLVQPSNSISRFWTSSPSVRKLFKDIPMSPQ